MKKHFYSHLVETDSLVIAINELDLREHEKAHLLSLVDDSLHHTILDVVLSELSEDDKRTFLLHLAYNDHSKIWEHLNTRVDNIEEKIKTVADDLKRELHKDIKEVNE